MPKKENLLAKLFAARLPRSFTTNDLDALMRYCNCEKTPGGRGSAISYYHLPTKRILRFDGPHPENTLYAYQVKMVRNFLIEIGEYERMD